MRRVKNMLLERRGDGYIDTLIKMCIMLSLVLCFIAIAPIFAKKQTVDYVAQSLARTIELTGEQGDAYEEELERLIELTNLNPNITIEAYFYDGTKLQLREPFTITVTVTEAIRIIDPLFAPALTISVPVTKTITGRSEVYWK